MSGIYIPGMEIPKSCLCCPCSGTDQDDGKDLWICEITHRPLTSTELCDNLPTDCPLAPVPEHGDLIDKSGVDVLSWTEDPKKDFYDGVLFVLDKLDELPVIIPADKEGEE